MNERVKTLLDGRRERLSRAAGRPLSPVAGDPAPLPEGDRSHLLDYAVDLYWNELEWENLTGEEALDGGPLPGLTFPGFLAYVRGLLLSETMPDALAPASPRPEVVDDVLVFLADRAVSLKEEITAAEDAEEQARLRVALALTDRLIDMVMFHLFGLSEAEAAAAEQALGTGN